MDRLKQFLSSFYARLKTDKVLLGLLSITCGMMVLYGVQTCGNDPDTQYIQDMNKWKAERTVLLHKNDSVVKQNALLVKSADSLNKAANTLSTKVTKITNVANKLQQTNDSLYSSLSKDSLTTCDGFCQEWKKLAISYKAEADTFKVALDSAAIRDSLRIEAYKKLELGNRSLLTQNDSLVHALVTVPEYKAPKLLGFIPLPTRTQSFIAGVVATVVTVVVVHR